MKKSITYAILALIVITLINSSLYQVNENQVAVITSFGRPVKAVEKSGLHAKWIYPFHKVQKFDRRLLTFDPQATELLTKDKKNLNVDAFLLWRIEDPIQFLVSVGNRSGAEARLADLLYSAMGTKIGQAMFSELISNVPGEMKLMEICRTIEESCYEIASEDLGIKVESVLIKRIAYPPQNRVAVFERMKAERGRIARRYRSEGEESAQKIRSGADLESALILAAANREALTIRGAGEAKAADIYRKSIQKDPEFFRFLRSLDAYKVFMDERSTVVIPNDSELMQVLRKGPPR
ncbi:protease modulator HflC [candidate division LCP-89 bacterium B3_LCP]|uniref:Protein HflC n=1 Tax=candidate division LCP-89 bacterium B3_LCP TaxID=2012998 RepID=A0A532V3E2_UNCL8|nr:MAG: protease modulator HflC [candidate division LCP-89 bacterium B3_LCP]